MTRLKTEAPKSLTWMLNVQRNIFLVYAFIFVFPVCPQNGLKLKSQGVKHFNPIKAEFIQCKTSSEQSQTYREYFILFSIF